LHIPDLFVYARHSTSTIYLIYLQMLQTTQFWFFF
jgi:hypothetical protein